jgi:hypothetical protein
MPRTREQLQKALTDTEAWLDGLDPKALVASESDAADLRAIGDALHAVAASDLNLADHVAKARANGRTWTQIAAVLGVKNRPHASVSGASPPVSACAVSNAHADRAAALTPAAGSSARQLLHPDADRSGGRAGRRLMGCLPVAQRCWTA